MSQNTDARRRAAERWSKLLLGNRVYDKGSVTEVLQELAEEFDKRISPVWDSNTHSIAWRNYFVVALNQVLRELPPGECSVEELRKKIEDMKLERTKPPVEAAAPINASAADDNTPTASKPVDTSTIDTTFKVDTQGDYKARVVEDGATTTLEFLLSGPATVTVQVHTSGTAAARTPGVAHAPTVPDALAVLAAAAAQATRGSADIPADGLDGTGSAKPAGEA